MNIYILNKYFTNGLDFKCYNSIEFKNEISNSNINNKKN